MILKFALGLIGLGIVVFVHELGHFIGARLMGIEVEAFSIGWGKPFLKKKIGAVEYRLGIFPLGGYCKMKGENDYQEAYDRYSSGKNSSGQNIPVEQQSSGDQGESKPPQGRFFSVSPLRRIIVSFMGPFFNILFAILVLSFIWGIGFEVSTLENRIVLLSDITPGSTYPADEGGLKTGDRIIEIKGRKIENYHDIQENIAVNPEERLPVKVERNNQILELIIRPSLEKSTGAGKIGVYNWTDPVIGVVSEESPADLAGLRPGDRILKINEYDFPYTVALMKILDEKPASLNLDFERQNRILHTEIPLTYSENGPENLGFYWETLKFRTPRLNPVKALIKGSAETWKTFAVSVKSLSLLFRGIDLTQAVSGPVRITYMMGEVAAEGFGQSFGMGISSMANFLALISIALCIMNLLPLPILDGGMIILHALEALRRKPLHPRAVYAFQTVGVVLIFGLMIFALFGDILFLTRR